jgi:dihydroorotase
MTKALDISIINGHLVDPANDVNRPLDIHIHRRRVLATGTPPAGFTPDLVIDAREQIVCPGLVDLSVRCREPGEAHKASIKRETRAAARAGITTLCQMPDTSPAIDTPAVATLVQKKAKQAGAARLLPVAALTKGLQGTHLTEMAALRDAGCIAFSNADQPITDTLMQKRAMEYAATYDLLTMIRPEDGHLRTSGCAHQGRVATRLGLPGIPDSTESIAIARDILLAREVGARIHFRGLSSGNACRLLQILRREYTRVSADVAAHQLHLTEMDVGTFNAQCHVNPPLRTLQDRQALRQALADGQIQAICSDHQPHDRDAKCLPFPETATGISALETLLPLTMRLVEEHVLSLSQAIAAVTAGPARILGLSVGTLAPGSNADVCVFHPQQPWILQAENMHSRGTNSPFLGWEFNARVNHTLFDGKPVFTRRTAS